MLFVPKKKLYQSHTPQRQPCLLTRTARWYVAKRTKRTNDPAKELTAPPPPTAVTPTAWVGLGLGEAVRPTPKIYSIYHEWSYSQVPRIDIDASVKDCQTTGDIPLVVKNAVQDSSPTYCRFNSQDDPYLQEKGIFLMDSKGVYCWKQNDDGSVSAVKASTGESLLVASSLAEFLTRIKLENNLWHKLHTPQTPTFTDAEFSLL